MSLPQKVVLRLARDEDYEFLSDLHEASTRRLVEAMWGWNDDFQAQFSREHFQPERLRVIELDGHAVRVIGFDVDAERLYIGPFEVDPSVQGRGIGSAALAEMFSIADDAGVPSTLQVLKINEEAFRLYRRVGFEVVDEPATHHLMRRERSANGGI